MLWFRVLWYIFCPGYREKKRRAAGWVMCIRAVNHLSKSNDRDDLMAAKLLVGKARELNV